MVKLKLRLNGLEADVVGALAAAAAVALGYGLLVHRPAVAALRYDSVLAFRQAGEAELVKLRQSCALKARQTDLLRSRLAERPDRLADSRSCEAILSKVNGLAAECDLGIIRWQPRGAEDNPEYRSTLYTMQGSASFAGVHSWLALLEAGVPLLDVTHFDMTAGGDPIKGLCEFSCDLRMYSACPQETVQLASARP